MDATRQLCIQLSSMHRWNLFVALFGTIVIGVFTSLLQGCNACYNRPNNPEQVREATANATAEIKNDTKAVAEGVRDGLRRPSAATSIELNSASKGQLTSLPGISDETAERIVANRPYRNTRDLLDRRLVSRDEYDRIADRVTVR